MPESPSTHSETRESVGITHVPVGEGMCLGVPDADLGDRTRFSLWSCALRSRGVFSSPGWRDLARRRYEADLERIGNHEPEALAALLVESPGVIELPEVAAEVGRVVARFDLTAFHLISKRLREKKKEIRPTALRKGGVHSVRVTHAMSKALAATVVTWEEVSGETRMRSQRRRITDALGLEKFEDDDRASHATQTTLMRYRKLRDGLYPRAVILGGPCPERSHIGAATLCWWSDMPIEKAPRLILGPEDIIVGGRNGTPIYMVG